MPKTVLSIFVSAVSKEFGSYRLQSASLLRKRGYLVKVQEEFKAGSGTLLEKLDKCIQSCDAVVCIIGDRYGAAPQTAEASSYSESPYSYTQYEYLLAKRHEKPVFVFLPESENTPRDEPLDEPGNLQLLQEDFKENEIIRKGVEYTPFADHNSIVQSILLCDFEQMETSTKVIVDTASPYVGLKRFEHSDQNYFFGRTSTIRDVEEVSENAALTLVMGNSGSGKSSLVRAGLIPAWIKKQKRKGFSNPRTVVLTPGSTPFDELWAGLVAAGVSSEDAAFARTPGTKVFVDVVDRVIKTHGEDQPCLFFVDQFEEIFTRISDENSQLRDQFVAALVTLAEKLQEDIDNSAIGPPIRIIIAMRDDFFGELREHKNLFQFTDRNLVRVVAMTNNELREVIEVPAQKHGVRFEKGLVRQIINSVEGSAGMLPLLQYTLEALWQEESHNGNLTDGEISLDTYKRLGGVEGALQKRVTSYYQSKSEDDRASIRNMLLSMVDPFGGGEFNPVSQAAEKSQLVESGSEQLLQELLDKEKLLISQDRGNKAMVELSHETLIRSWPEFKNWIHDNREVIKIRNQLSEDANQWGGSAGTRNEGDLWRGSRLERALELGSEGELDRIRRVSSVEKSFLETCKTLKAKELRRAHTLSLIAAVVAVFAVGLAFFAQQAREQAARNLDNANLQIANAWKERSRRFEESKDYFGAALTAAKGLGYSGFGRQENGSDFNEANPVFLDKGNAEHQNAASKLQAIALHNVSQISHWKTVGHSSSISALAWHPDGKLLASGSSTGEAFLWDRNGRVHANIGKFRHKKPVTAIQWSPDGATAVFCYSSDALQVVDTQGRILIVCAKWNKDVSSIEWSRDSSSFAICNKEKGDVFIYDRKIPTDAAPSRVPKDPDLVIETGKNGVNDLDWNGPYLAMLCDRNQVKVWDGRVTTTAFDLADEEAESEEPWVAISQSPSTGSLLAITASGKAVEWSLEKSENRWHTLGSPDQQRLLNSYLHPTHRIALNQEDIPEILGNGSPTKIEHAEKLGKSSTFWDPENRWFAGAVKTKALAIWNTEGKAIRTANLHAPLSGAFNWSPDGKRFAFGAVDGSLAIVESEGGASVLVESYNDPVTSVSWSPAGVPQENQVLAACSLGGQVKLLRRSDGECVALWKTVHETPCSVAWSNQATLAVASQDGSVELRDYKGKRLGEIPSPLGGVPCIAWNIHGDTLAVGTFKGKVTLYNLQRKPIGEHQTRVDSKQINHITQISWHHTKNQIVFCDERRRIYLADIEQKSDGSAELKISAELQSDTEITAMAWGPGTDDIAFSGKDGKVRVWTPGKESALVLSQPHKDIVSTIAWSPDGKFLASASWDKTVNIWRRAVKTEPVSTDQFETIAIESDGGRRGISCLSWSSDSQLLASGSWGGSVVIRDSTGKIQKQIVSHNDAVTTLEWSPDGLLVATGSGDSQVRTFHRDQRSNEFLAMYLERGWVNLNEGDYDWSAPARDPTRSAGWVATILQPAEQSSETVAGSGINITEGDKEIIEPHDDPREVFQYNYADWQISHSATKTLTQDELLSLDTDEKLYKARNELFARRGFIFSSSDGIKLMRNIPSHYYIGASGNGDQVEGRFNDYESTSLNDILKANKEFTAKKKLQ